MLTKCITPRKPKIKKEAIKIEEPVPQASPESSTIEKGQTLDDGAGKPPDPTGRCVSPKFSLPESENVAIMDKHVKTNGECIEEGQNVPKG